MGIVYKICFPDDSVYFGQTTTRLSTRMASHRMAAKSGIPSPIYQKIREKGLDLSWVSELAVLEDEEMLSLLESEYIDQARLEEPLKLLNVNSKTKVNRSGHQNINFRKNMSERLRSKEPLELHTNSKLTETEVRKMFELSSQGERRDAIAHKFGISKDYLSDIFTGKTWGHLDRSNMPKPKLNNQRKTAPILIGDANPKSKLSEEKVLEILRRAATGENRSQIAVSFGVTRQLVQSVITGTAWPQVKRPEGLKSKIRIVRQFSKEEEEEIVKRLDAGESSYKVAKDLNRNANCVLRFYKRIKGLTPSPKPDKAV